MLYKFHDPEYQACSCIRTHCFATKKWHDDKVWNLFVASKLADSDRLFRALYAFCKSESRRQGTEVMVVGNTIPIFPGAGGAKPIVPWQYVSRTLKGRLQSDGAPKLVVPSFEVYCRVSVPTQPEGEQ